MEHQQRAPRTTVRRPEHTSAPDDAAPTGATELHPRTSEFRSEATELAYRTDQMRRDAGRLATTGLLAAALMFGFTLVDFGSLGVSAGWFGLMAARAIASGTVARLALGVRRDPDSFVSASGRRLITGVEVLVLSVFLVICAARPDDVVTHSVSAVLMALVIAIFVPGTVKVTSAIVASFYAGFMVVAHLRFPEDVNLVALSANLGVTAVFAYVVVTVLNRSRRMEWLATLEQRRVNERLVAEARAGEELRLELERLAAQDTLTGLANRRSFFERGAQLLQSSRERGDIVVAVLMDVDGFKAVNDRFGHPAGDALLQAIGSALRDVTRRDELVGRIGGEEFAVVATVPSPADASALAERLRAAVREAHAVVDQQTVAATASVGFTEVDDHEDVGAALARADRAMYDAKRAGGDRVLCGVS